MPTVTIYISHRGAPLVSGGTSQTGHMWYQLNDSIGASESYGFAPIQHGDPHGPGQVYTTDSANYTEVSYAQTFEISQHQFEVLQSFGQNPTSYGFSDTYDGFYNSCVDFTWAALEEIGFNPSSFDGDVWPTHNINDVRNIKPPKRPGSWYDHFIEDLRDRYDGVQDRTYRTVRYDPLALDLDGDGLITTVAEQNYSGALFDHDGDGIRTATGWVGANDGLLVRDIDGDGLITSGAELFGDRTLLGNGGQAQHGFSALADLDGNGDGVVDASDTAFSSLRLWQDADGDGVTDAGELRSLADLGITSLSTGFTNSGNSAVTGGTLMGVGAFTRTGDGGANIQGLIGDFNFDHDGTRSEYLEDIDVPSEFLALPDMEGVGMLRDLRQAATLSEALEDALHSFADATTRESQRALIDDVLLEWARTSPAWQDLLPIMLNAGGGVEDPNSENIVRLRPGEVLAWPDPIELSVEDRRLIRTVEAILGLTPTQAVWWGEQSLAQYRTIHAQIMEAMYGELVIQSRLKPYLAQLSIQWSSTEGRVVHDFSQLDAMLSQKYLIDPLNAIIDLAELLKYQGPELAGGGYREGFSQLQEWATDNAGNAQLVLALQEIGVVLTASGSGQSQAEGTQSADVILGTSQSIGDYIRGQAGDDLISSEDGTDSVYGDAGNDTILAGADDDYISAGDGNDMVLGEAGRDSLRGDAGDDALDGGAGDDAIFGGVGNDRLYGGLGEDYLSGDRGNDVYVFRRGDGHDRINNYDDGAGRQDTLLLENLLPGGIKMWRSGNYLCISILGTEDRVDIQNFFDADGTSAYRLDRIQFADGTVWDIDEIKDRVLSATEGDDDIYGYETDDVISGGSQSDWLSGRGGNDTLSGGTGADSLHGDDGNDVLNGDDGNDNLFGGTGADQLFGGAEDDRLDGGQGNDELTGGEGEDHLEGGRGDDIYHFSTGFGNDVISNYDDGPGRVDAIQFSSGITSTDVTLRREGDDLVLVTVSGDELRVLSYFASDGLGASRVDEIRFQSGVAWNVSTVLSMVQASTDGDDILQGYAGSDAISGGNGDDDIRGGSGNDMLSGDAGMDLIDGGAGNDQVHGGEGSDTLFGGEGDDVVTGGAEMDALSGGAGNDQLEGGDERDWLNGGEGNDLLLGGDAADELLGAAGEDHLTGGTGDDRLAGGEGDDHYYFQRGDGQDVVNDVEGYSTLHIGDLTLAEAVLRRDGTALILRFGSSATDSVRFENFFDTATGLALYGLRLTETGGSTSDFGPLVIDAETLRGTLVDDVIHGNSLGNTISGLAGNDTVHAGDGDDAVSGGQGADSLYGQAGSDYLAGEDGHDALFGGEGSDSLVGGSGEDTLDGGRGADLMHGGSGDDLYIVDDILDVVVEASGEGLDVVQSHVSHTLSEHVEELELLGSESIDGAGNGLANVLQGNEAGNTIEGRAGNDQLHGRGDSDVLLGGDGEDLLDGGQGADTLHGGIGDDLYVVDQANDLIVELVGEGLDVVHASSDYVLSGNVEELVLIEGSAASQGTGSADDNVITGNSSSNRIDGAAGSDRMIGGAGDDTYVVDQAGDVVVELDGDGNDTVEASINYALGDTVESLVLLGDEDLSATGNEGDNLLVGNSGDNLIDGAQGGDNMYGGLGADYYINDSSEDWIHEMHNEGDDTVERRYETNLVLSGNVENLILAAGVVTGNGNGLNNTITGNTEDNTLGGWDGDDVLHGLDGNDALFGGDGADDLQGGAGNDYLDGGAGFDHLEGGAGNDVYITDDSGDVVVEAAGAGTDQVQTTASYALSANIENLFLMEGGAIDGAGNSLDNYIAGNSGANVIDGGGGNDTLVAGGGDDTLYGGTGDDKYVFDENSGSDVIGNSDGGFDGVFFTGGITRERLTFSRDGDDLLIFVDAGATPAVRVLNHFLGGNAAIDYVQPDGGFYLTTTEINQIVAGGGTGGEYDQVIEGTASAEQLVGGNGKDLIKGVGGNDQLFGMSGNDTLQGGDGDDYLAGGNGSGSGSGNDRLEGGAGADTLAGQDGANVLIGGAGNDSYVYGGGQDTIDNTGGGYDGVFFNNGILADDLAFSREGDDLLITVDGNASATVRVTNHFLGGDYAIDFVQPASGSLLNTVAINALAEDDGGNPGGGGNEGNDDDYSNVVTGTASGEQLLGTSGRDLIRGLAGNDTLFGFGGDDKFEGGDGDDYISGGNGSFNGSGNDILIGGNGNDTLVGEDGADMLIGGAGDDDYYYSAGSGSDTIDNVGGGTDWVFFNGIARERLSFHQDGDDLLIRVDASAASQVRVLGHFLGGGQAISYVQPGSGYAIPASQIPGLLTSLPQSFAAVSSGSSALIAQEPNTAGAVLASGYGRATQSLPARTESQVGIQRVAVIQEIPLVPAETGRKPAITGGSGQPTLVEPPATTGGGLVPLLERWEHVEMPWDGHFSNDVGWGEQWRHDLPAVHGDPSPDIRQLEVLISAMAGFGSDRGADIMPIARAEHRDSSMFAVQVM